MRTQRVNGVERWQKWNVLRAGCTSRFCSNPSRTRVLRTSDAVGVLVRTPAGRPLRSAQRCFGDRELAQFLWLHLAIHAVAGVERALRARRAIPNEISAARSDEERLAKPSRVCRSVTAAAPPSYYPNRAALDGSDTTVASPRSEPSSAPLPLASATVVAVSIR